MWVFDIAWALAVFVGALWLATRLLAVRLGLLTALVCGALGVAAGLGLEEAIVADSADGFVSYATFAALTLLTTMALVAILGLAARPRRPSSAPAGVSSGLPHPLRALRMRAARATRYLTILWLGARYGFGPLTGLRRADTSEIGVALRDALQEAGGIFVKFGQMLSARSDLVPATIALELSSLQDDAKPLPAEVAREVIDRELGVSAVELFAEFDETPLAAASIAQVHRARLSSGEQVVIKVQRPDVERLVERDLDILRRLAGAAEDRAVWARRVGTVALADGFAANLEEELDFRIEAQNMAAIGAHNGPLRTPRVYRSLSTRRVLVEQWIEGQTLRQAQQGLDAPARKLLARSLLEGMLGQIFDFGVFHADPHAGNVLIDDDGHAVLLDFGSVGRLDRLQQPALAQALAAISRGRPTLLRDALLDLSTSTDTVDVDGLERALARFFAQRLGPGMEPGADILNDLLAIVVRFGLALDPQLAGVFRALATLDGTLRLIDPTFSVIDEARQYAQARKLGLPRPEQFKEELLEDVIELVPMLRKIPRRLDRITAGLERGDLSMRIRPLADPRDVAFITTIVNRLILALFSASIGLVAVFLLRVGGGADVFGTQLNVVLGYGGLVAATALGLRVIAAITRDAG